MRFFISILLAVLLCSCTKGGGNIYVEGRVYNPVTGEGISDVELRLYRPEMGGTIGNSSGNKTVETVYTDAEGHYEVSHLGGAYTYRLRISPDHEKFYALGTAPNNFDVSVGNGAFIVEKGTNMEVDFELVPYGEFKFKIDNVNCQGSSDYFKLFHYGSRFGYKDGLSDQALREGQGCYTYDQNYFAKVPAGGRYYRWEVTRNGTTQTYYDTFYVESGQQKIFTIEY